MTTATLTTGNPTIDAAIAAGLAIAGPLAAANPYAAAGIALASEGIRFYTDLMERSARGETTLADLEAAADRVDAKLDTFRRNVEAAEAKAAGG